LDFEGRCIYVNEAFSKKYSFFGDTLLNAFFDKNLHAQDLEKYQDVLKKCTQGNYTSQLDVRKYNTLDENYYLVQGEMSILRDTETAAPVGSIYIVHHIIQEASTPSHKNLHNLNQLLNAILESPKGIIVFSLDKNYNYLYFTNMHKETMKNIWGVDIEIGSNMLECIHDDGDRKRAQRNFDRALRGDYFIEVEEYGDENLFRTHWEDRYSPIFNQNSEIIGITVFVTNITDQKKAEQVIKESEHRLDLLANNFPDGSISLIDMNLKILYTGGAEYKKQGWNPKDFIGMNIKEAFYEDLYYKIKSSLPYIQKGNNFTFEDTYQNKIYQNILQPIFSEKKSVSSFILVSTDITDRKNYENKIMTQNEKLRKIAWQQSHEVRKPVANILGLIDLIQMDKEKIYEEVYLQYLKEATEELDEIIHSIVRATDQ